MIPSSAGFPCWYSGGMTLSGARSCVLRTPGCIGKATGIVDKSENEM